MPKIDTKLLGETIGKYSVQDTKKFVSEGLINTTDAQKDDRFTAYSALYERIAHYKAEEHQNKIERYAQTHSLTLTNVDINDPHFFRKALIARVNTVMEADSNQYKGDVGLRKIDPEKATITLDKLLNIAGDTKGVDLYKYALEEERFSEEYMNAVLEKSTTHYAGQPLATRPVVIVAGPSACGKTSVAKKVVEEIANNQPKKEGSTKIGFDVVAVDGGITREVSQMRKLVIQCAIQKGFTGIEDLHSKSKALDNVKDCVQNYAFKTPNLGVVIPDTFSDVALPIIGSRHVKLFNTIDQLVDTKAIFCRIDGANPDNFKKSVEFMGSQRAWKIDDFKEQPIDLNIAEIPESKAYGSFGFRFGCVGSEKAEKIFIGRNPNEAITINITNDFILLKPTHVLSEDNSIDQRPIQWIKAEAQDPEVILISDTVYRDWLTAECSAVKNMSLTEFEKVNRKPFKMNESKGAIKQNTVEDWIELKALQPPTTQADTITHARSIMVDFKLVPQELRKNESINGNIKENIKATPLTQKK